MSLDSRNTKEALSRRSIVALKIETLINPVEPAIFAYRFFALIYLFKPLSYLVA
jgi:hypothetical protein